MKIEYRDGLLFTSIEITYKGKSKVIDNIVVDTGAENSLISQEEVDEIGIRISKEDEIVTSYGIGGTGHAFIKTVDEVKISGFKLNNFSIDFTVLPYEDINGLLGLDILIEGGFIIDLDMLKIHRKD
ncbi:aspartyl protease [Orenia metallireducens]|uniref:Aspartyl protease n=1 Tax=Orenia metallireducens TaxID=1413210 RepID=A0A1C0A4W5_9FIRM|nr:retropepsin-like aspartic protease [Orenia metallireducens]OCL25187.1 aspartyl protease [Orenia metallireducens]